MHVRLLRASALALMLLTAAATPAFAACWIDRERPTTADNQPVTSPRVAAMRAATQAINKALKANAALQALPDVRIRSTW